MAHRCLLVCLQTLWQTLGRNKDYIRNKKPNGYQSLHTVVRADDGHELEVQIRTYKMHYMAEYGEWLGWQERAAALNKELQSAVRGQV